MQTNWGGPLCTVSQTTVTQVASTIMLGPKYSSDIEANCQGQDWTGCANTAGGFMLTSTFLWDFDEGLSNKPYYYVDAGGAWAAIPNGNRAKSTNFWKQPKGSVSVSKTGTSNFTFADGHSKAMKPEATNPNGVQKPELNMWDSKR